MFCLLCENAICLLAYEKKTKIVTSDPLSTIIIILTRQGVCLSSRSQTKQTFRLCKVCFPVFISNLCSVWRLLFFHTGAMTMARRHWISDRERNGRREELRKEGLMIISFCLKRNNKSQIKTIGSDDMNLFNPI